MRIDTEEFLVVLPARIGSSRLPGKPLKDIGGKPMIVRSFYNVRMQSGSAAVVVATDDRSILDVCLDHGIPCCMTSGSHKTGTDRVAEVAKRYMRPYIINAQPDEPLLHDGVVRRIMEEVVHTGSVCCGMSKIATEADVLSPSVGKVVATTYGKCLYISRQPIPNAAFGGTYWTQTCVYGFPYRELMEFADMPQSPLEISEGIELLRWLENGRELRMPIVPGERLSVDTPEDLERVRRIFLDKHSESLAME